MTKLIQAIKTWWYQRHHAPFTVEREWSIFVGWLEPMEVFGLKNAIKECKRHVRRFRYGQAFVRSGHGLRRDWWNVSSS
jgi:hypothetical protein